MLTLDGPQSWRDQVIAEMARKGIELGDYFPAVHLLDFYGQRYPALPGTLPVTEDIAGRTVALPFFTAITAKQQVTVCDELARVLTSRR